MRETVLLFNFKDKQKLLNVELVLFPLKVRIKKVDKKDYLQPVGLFAGSKDVEAVDNLYEGDELEKEMMIFCNLPEQKLNLLLSGLRNSKAGPIPYKAVLTSVNQHWNALRCFEELKAEHAAITKKELTEF